MQDVAPAVKPVENETAFKKLKDRLLSATSGSVEESKDASGFSFEESESTVSITVVGASGDLAKKKIFPALFALYYEGCLPKHFTICGYARSKMTDAELRTMVSKTLTCRIDQRENCGEKMDQFLERCFYYSGQYDSQDHFAQLDKKLKEHEVVDDVVSSRNITEWLQNNALEQLMEFTSHLYKFLEPHEITKETWLLTEEGKTYAVHGTPEVRLFLSIPQEGITKDELQKKFDALVFKIACAQAAKNKWVDFGKKLVTRKDCLDSAFVKFWLMVLVMMDIRKRFHSEDEADGMDEDVDADSALSEKTIKKVLPGGEVSFDDLSAEEKKLFQRAVASGELSKMIKPWDPWWLKPSARTISFSKEGTQLIQPLAKEDEPMSPEEDQESSQASEIPPGPETPLPPLSKLSSAKPSPFLAVHLVDIIYSYCFALRLYNGDWQSDATGSAMVVLSVSSVLGQGGQPETVLEALSYCLEQTCSPAFRQMGGVQFGLGLVDDVITLLTLGTPALLCLLCDLQRMVQAGETELKSEKPRKSRRAEIRSKLKQAERKIYFLMCWVHEQPGEAWSSLGAIVRAEKSSAMNYEAVSRSGKPDNKAEPRSKVLIQEIKDI